MAMNVFSLKAILGLDSSEYEQGLGEAKSKATSIGSAIGKGLATIGKATVATIGTATAAVGAFGTAALNSYANYEQLVGGVDRLYGTASGKLQEYANKAFLTAGMSANSYMETATSFSAALISSLGGDVDKAADMTDMAMKAMSDNINVFGSDAESVQNTFQSLARGQYQMLDNLKLGYGGTKEGMQELIDDANEYRASIGEAADLSIDSFADIIQAIQSVQEAQHIAGTTNAEAMKTIEGSANATKAAWGNVITAIGRGEGLSDALNGLTTAIFGTDSSTGLLNQVIPRIQTIMESIGDFVGTAGPFIAEKMPVLISSIVPSMISAGMQLLGALGEGIIDSLPTLIDAAVQIVQQIGQGLITAAPYLLNGAIQVISSLGQMLIDNLPSIVGYIAEMVAGLAQMIADNADAMVEGAIQLITTLAVALLENLPTVLSAVLQIVLSVAATLIAHIPDLLVAIGQILLSIIQTLGEGNIEILAKVSEFLGNVLNSIAQWIVVVVASIVKFFLDAKTKLDEWVSNIISKITSFFSSVISKATTWFSNLISKVVQFFSDSLTKLIKWVSDIINKMTTFVSDMKRKATEAAEGFVKNLLDGVAELPSKFYEVGSNIVNGIWEGIKSGWDWLTDSVRDLAGSLFDAAKDVLGISSPSKKFMWIGEMSDRGFAEGLEKYKGLVDKAMEEVTAVPEITATNTINPASSQTVSENHVIINVYGAAGQDINELAEIISRKIDGATNRRMVAMGVS